MLGYAVLPTFPRNGPALFAAAGVIAACGSTAAPTAAPPGDGGVDASADVAVGEDATSPVDAPSDAPGYSDGSLWLCGANAAHDYCLDPQTVTDIHPDLSQTTSSVTPLANPSVDCFYVYPSVDVSSPAGNEINFDNLQDILDPVRSQAAPFVQVCKVYAPLYHQATFQSYYTANADQYLEVAYADVAAAFHEYMTVYNQGRFFVLLGHSQGSHMLRRLIQRVVEPSPAIESQMLLAVLAGTLGDTYVPKGQVVGGSFKNTPLCTSAAQRGCVLTFSTFAKGYEPTSSYPDFALPTGMDVACANPAAPGGGKATLADALIFTQYKNTSIDPPQNTGVSTPFAGYAGFFTGQCLASATGYSFFEVDAEPGAGDGRSNPIPFGNVVYTPSLIGLHLLDYAFPMGDLLVAVQARTGGGAVDASAD
jgi:Protein of unknown function (DUF3089)